jgi:hypothetical protein
MLSMLVPKLNAYHGTELWQEGAIGAVVEKDDVPICAVAGLLLFHQFLLNARSVEVNAR